MTTARVARDTNTPAPSVLDDQPGENERTLKGRFYDLNFLLTGKPLRLDEPAFVDLTAPQFHANYATTEPVDPPWSHRDHPRPEENTR
ncbi:hypothetical protein [Brachybacterium kimchii]|uniref:Uncharacterized protein n=1 Tax=Brachybacterium kimchii TaxID=2942909 RepID=A0ABY4NB48_9MICO|nr:hypothetical protein [Brachybacterium kimchii]UQN31767.1 hypothetical protein M4486_19450 [Brachybacterium kimchii]